MQQKSEAIIVSIYLNINQGLYLVRRRIFAEANISVNAKAQVFDGQLGDCLICINHRL